MEPIYINRATCEENTLKKALEKAVSDVLQQLRFKAELAKNNAKTLTSVVKEAIQKKIGVPDQTRGR